MEGGTVGWGGITWKVQNLIPDIDRDSIMLFYRAYEFYVNYLKIEYYW